MFENLILNDEIDSSEQRYKKSSPNRLNKNIY